MGMDAVMAECHRLAAEAGRKPWPVTCGCGHHENLHQYGHCSACFSLYSRSRQSTYCDKSRDEVVRL